ncbi:hypothetical protein [Streptomyces sp. NBC_01294]|uniref:hypothetical protein n=1 Tax=Streptomyces sp. NBC_01294 TaxID=2903815 RepID=UPI002DDB67C0|nr:hypothetical protein [Streptomyces sp. NBC_01294]WRZ55843.1 hypothetical protein OG534_04735 [Streptomyces sp. NBC_01294]
MPFTDRHTRRIRPSLAAVAAVCVAALLCGGCAGKTEEAQETQEAGKTEKAGKAAEAAGPPSSSIEEIATAIGCTAEVSVEAEELRQGGCETGQGPYRMATFAADTGLRSWLTEAQTYGGLYLVGDRWVVTAQTTEALTALRERLGGSLETGAAHGEHAAHS